MEAATCLRADILASWVAEERVTDAFGGDATGFSDEMSYETHAQLDIVPGKLVPAHLDYKSPV